MMLRTLSGSSQSSGTEPSSDGNGSYLSVVRGRLPDQILTLDASLLQIVPQGSGLAFGPHVDPLHD